jgi:prolyl 4-hydroxylase
MSEALDRTPPYWLEVEILEYLSYALYMQGNPKRAYVMTKKLAEMNPEHPRAPGNVLWYEEKLASEDKDDPHDLPPLSHIIS